jgi:hypothetical protein
MFSLFFKDTHLEQYYGSTYICYIISHNHLDLEGVCLGL